MSRAKRPPSADETLFTKAAAKDTSGSPLAERMRPRTLDAYVGQSHVLGPGKLLARAIESDRVPSMILWGPPGSGKTTLARIVAEKTRSFFVMFSAVLGSVGELRLIVEAAKERLAYRGERTIVFVDEIHRFNKAQQDAFLPHVEAGTITLIGATTENPSFAVNAALLSRSKVFRLESLARDQIVALLRRALVDVEHGLGSLALEADDDALAAIAEDSRGDARRALNTLEVVAAHVHSTHARIDLPALEAAHAHSPLLYDKAGEEHYNVTSAFIKSMRGSDPDAAVYWLMRMLDAGDDPLFLARRMIIFASEDVGNADPRALLVANAADEAFRRLGMPEGIYPLAHAALYLACAPKSNAVKNAWQRARAMIEARGALPVPMKLRNAVTKLMKEDGYGASYRYPHDEGGVAPGETYLPDEIATEVFYEPTDRGEETRMKARIEALRAARKT
jgi:putative ATPase